MSSDELGRAQDQGRKHRRRSDPSPATASLLAEYQAAMRDELRSTLVEIRGTDPGPGLGLVAAERKRPALGERIKLWDLAIKLGRELGTEVDTASSSPAAAEPGARRGPRRGRVEYGP